MPKIIQVPFALGIGDDSNWNLPDEVFGSLSASCKLSFSQDFRNKVRWLLMSHITVANLITSSPDADDVFGRFVLHTPIEIVAVHDPASQMKVAA